MVNRSQQHKIVYWPAEADLEDALNRWDLTPQDLLNTWYPGTPIREIANELQSFRTIAPTTNILRDASIFASYINDE